MFVAVSDSDKASHLVSLPEPFQEIEKLVFSKIVTIKNTPPNGGINSSAHQAADAIDSFAELLKRQTLNRCEAVCLLPAL
jgi:hypothetical protein